MDRRSWPWKKKSSEKAAAEKVAATLESALVSVAAAASRVDQGKQDVYKKPSYVQISVESYTHLTGLEDQVKSYEEQVKTLEDEVKELNEKLSMAESEITTKESLVKQHNKVAEEAVSGWEKAEAEAAALKNHLESVTLLKLTAEDRASHLDGALKECMRQIRNLKEEHEQKLHDVVLSKTKQWEKIKHELEFKISDLEQELAKSDAENAALSRSLQERSSMVIKVSEEKSRAEANVELLKANIESCEKEISSLKYEIHVVTKELDIRNEEKNMCVRSAEVANKQHLEGVKKIAKLEAECQRLRGLVRKKLPGPAALAQMKLEVENLGQGYGETRQKRSPVKPSSTQQLLLPEFSHDTVHRYHKDNELLTERLLAMEEETKMLKEALAKRNSELQASRSACAKTVCKLRSLEAQGQANNGHTSPHRSSVYSFTEGLPGQYFSSAPSMASMSEYGNDDEASCAGSWATVVVSEPPHLGKAKNLISPNKTENASPLRLMDDFLEMEKLAHDSKATISTPNGPDTRPEIASHDTHVELTTYTDSMSHVHCEMDHFENQMPIKLVSALDKEASVDLPPLVSLQSRLSRVFESMSKDADMDDVLENIKQVLQDIHGSLHPQSASCAVEATHSSSNGTKDGEASVEHNQAAKGDLCFSHGRKGGAEMADSISQGLKEAISQIHDFLLLLGKEAKSVQDTSPCGDELSQKLESFSTTFNDIINNRMSLDDFVLDLSLVLTKFSELHFNVLGYKYTEAENSCSDCIDKVVLPENKDVHDTMGQKYQNGSAHFSDSTSDAEIPHSGNIVPATESITASWKCSLEEFEQLKSEKDNLAVDLAACSENLESTKSQLQETEELLAEVKSQLISAQKSNGLAETQLKCMAESYMALETRAEELQTEVNLLQMKLESLEGELQDERISHQDSLATCKDLQEQLRRFESPAADDDARANQENELVAAAEKLAECQETIFLLGKQVKAMQPRTEFMGSPHRERGVKGERAEEEASKSGMNMQVLHQADSDTNRPSVGSDSLMVIHSAQFSPPVVDMHVTSPSSMNSKQTRHRPSKSGSYSGAQTPERQSRGFKRFFSSNGKNSY